MYLRNLCAIHLVLATMVLALFGAATLLRAWLRARHPGLLPEADDGWLSWSPCHFLLPVAVVAVTAIPFGWGYWFIRRDKNRQLSDWLAAPTAILIAILSAGALYMGAVDQEKLRWVARFLVLAPLLALLAWSLAAVQARRQAGVDIEVSTRAKLSQWLAASLIVAVCGGAAALVDTLGQTLYGRLLSNGTSASVKGGGLMAVVAALLAAVSRLAPLLGEAQGQRHVSLPRNVVAGVAALVVCGWILVSLSAVVHLVAWQGVLPGAGRPMSVVALTWLTLGATVFSLLSGLTIRFVNSSSHQALYGNRLTRAYLGASNPHRFKDSVGQRLSDPIRGDNIGWGEYAPFELGGPLHLVNVTLNETVLGASQVEQRDRKGLPMAIGPCGLSGGLESHALWKQQADETQATADHWQGRLPGTEDPTGSSPSSDRTEASTCLRAWPSTATRSKRSASGPGPRSPARRSRPGSAPAPAWRCRCCSGSRTCGSATGGTRTSGRASVAACARIRRSVIGSASWSTPGSRCRRTCSRSSPRASSARIASAGT